MNLMTRVLDLKRMLEVFWRAGRSQTSQEQQKTYSNPKKHNQPPPLKKKKTLKTKHVRKKHKKHNTSHPKRYINQDVPVRFRCLSFPISKGMIFFSPSMEWLKRTSLRAVRRLGKVDVARGPFFGSPRKPTNPRYNGLS